MNLVTLKGKLTIVTQAIKAIECMTKAAQFCTLKMVFCSRMKSFLAVSVTRWLVGKWAGSGHQISMLSSHNTFSTPQVLSTASAPGSGSGSKDLNTS